MRIAIVQGSPRRRVPTTGDSYQDVFHQCYPEVASDTFKISLDIKRLENDRAHFDGVIRTIAAADGLLWITPVYYTVVPAQLKRFIELLFERGVSARLAGKPTAVLTTSASFYDHTALNYMRAICEDLDLCYVDEFAATVAPAFGEEYTKNLASFYRGFIDALSSPPIRARQFSPPESNKYVFTPEPVTRIGGDSPLKVALLTDADPTAPNLQRMIDTFVASASFSVDRINLGELVRTGCRGCLHCGYDGACAIQDDFVQTYRERVLSADALIWAGTIKDRFLSATWKAFFDRSFVTNHINILTDKQVGLIISGPLRANANIRECLVGLIENHRANFAGLVTDEDCDATTITAQLQQLAKDVATGGERQYRRPGTYRAVGGDKIFRDLVYLLRFPFRVDYRHFKQHRFPSFPQKQRVVATRGSLMLLAAKFVRDKGQLVDWYIGKMLATLREALEVDEEAAEQRRAHAPVSLHIRPRTDESDSDQRASA